MPILSWRNKRWLRFKGILSWFYFHFWIGFLGFVWSFVIITYFVCARYSGKTGHVGFCYSVRLQPVLLFCKPFFWWVWKALRVLHIKYSLIYSSFFFLMPSAAHGSSQAMDLIWATAALHSHSNKGSPTHWGGQGANLPPRGYWLGLFLMCSNGSSFFFFFFF